MFKIDITFPLRKVKNQEALHYCHRPITDIENQINIKEKRVLCLLFKNTSKNKKLDRIILFEVRQYIFS